MTFRVRQKVVCIKQRDPSASKGLPSTVKWPEKDGVYTIRAINEWPEEDGGTLLRFEELDNRHLEGAVINGYRSKIEPGFPAKYFVPEKVSHKDRVRA